MSMPQTNQTDSLGDPRPTSEQLARIRHAYARARECHAFWMATSRVGDLLAEVSALTAENAALRHAWQERQELADAASGKAGVEQ